MQTSTLLLLALCALLLLALLGWWRAATRTGRRNLRRLRVAQAGERDAERLLERAGYQVLDRQLTCRYDLFIDGEPTEVSCRADLLVARDGETFIAEVKTGERAPDPRRPATRRQLLEYLHAFDVDGVLLVDIHASKVIEVSW